MLKLTFSVKLKKNGRLVAKRKDKIYAGGKTGQ